MDKPLETEQAKCEFGDSLNYDFVRSVGTECYTIPQRELVERIEKLEAFMDKALANPMIAGMLD